MGRVILSAFADEYSAQFDEQLAALRGFSIDRIEIRGVDGKNISALTEKEVREARRKLDEYGILASAIGSPIGKVRLDADLDAHLDMAKRVFESANILGTKYVRMFSFYAPRDKVITDCRGEVFSELERLADAAKAAGVVLCHENEAEIYGSVPERCREIADTFGDIRTVFDMGNYVLEGVKPYEAYCALAESIQYFHIKDALFAGAIVPPGKGEADIQRIISDYSRGERDFVVSLEPHLQLFSGLNGLVGRRFDNPYKYNSQEEAFSDAVTKIKELLKI